MNLLHQMNAIFGTVEKGFAKIIGKKAGGTLIAQTPSGATVLLIGKAEIGKNVFYNKATNQVLDDAPDVEFKEYAV